MMTNGAFGGPTLMVIGVVPALEIANVSLSPPPFEGTLILAKRIARGTTLKSACAPAASPGEAANAAIDAGADQAGSQESKFEQGIPRAAIALCSTKKNSVYSVQILLARLRN